VKRVVDYLSATGYPISFILDGLLEEYDSLITFITSRLDPYIVEDIESLLLAQEDHFGKHKILYPSLAQANLAYTNWVPSSSSKPSFHGGHDSSRMYYNNKRQNFPRPFNNNSSSAFVSSSS